MEYQDLEKTKSRTAKMYLQNPRRSISATFGNLRNKSYNATIGDYPLLYTIIDTILGLSINLNRSKINYALNKSQELKHFSKLEKKELLSQLIKPTYVQIKLTKFSLEDAERTKDE